MAVTRRPLRWLGRRSKRPVRCRWIKAELQVSWKWVPAVNSSAYPVGWRKLGAPFKCHLPNHAGAENAPGRHPGPFRQPVALCSVISDLFCVCVVQTVVLCTSCVWDKWTRRAWCERWERRCSWDRWPQRVIFNAQPEQGLYKEIIAPSVGLILIQPDSGSVHQRGGAETLWGKHQCLWPTNQVPEYGYSASDSSSIDLSMFIVL